MNALLDSPALNRPLPGRNDFERIQGQRRRRDREPEVGFVFASWDIDGAHFEERHIGYGLVHTYVNGKEVPKDVWNACFDLEDEDDFWRVLAYWMADVEGHCCRYCEWQEAWHDFHDLDVQVDADDRLHRIDPDKLPPQARAELLLKTATAWARVRTLEDGASAIFEGREPEVFTAASFGIEAVVDQGALFSMAGSKPAARNVGTWKSTPAPVPAAKQASLF